MLDSLVNYCAARDVSLDGHGCALWEYNCRAVILTLFYLNLQLFWERKLSGLNTFDIAEELVKTMDLPKGLQSEPQI